MRRFFVLILWAGCAAPSAPGAGDLSAVTGVDLASGVDASSSRHDLAESDGPQMCTLGTPDHCGTCGTVCPPGMDTTGTQRSCSLPTAFGMCDFVCKGEFYDVDGKTANGCEAEDQPIQDSAITAVVVNLPNAFNADLGVTGNPANEVSQVYGDARTHATAPTTRPLGREDWYKLQVTGGGSGSNGVTACLGITNFPADDMFEVCLSQVGSATFAGTDCAQVTGGAASQCVAKPMAADESGTYYARVRKLSGSGSALQYALFLEH